MAGSAHEFNPSIHILIQTRYTLVFLEPVIDRSDAAESTEMFIFTRKSDWSSSLPQTSNVVKAVNAVFTVRAYGAGSAGNTIRTRGLIVFWVHAAHAGRAPPNLANLVSHARFFSHLL